MLSQINATPGSIRAISERAAERVHSAQRKQEGGKCYKTYLKQWSKFICNLSLSLLPKFTKY